MAAFVIAEIGVNHNGDIRNAYSLIRAAKDAGADAVKFQAFSPERLDPPGEWRDMLMGLSLGRSEFEMLSHYCGELAIEFMATPFDALWITPLIKMGMKRIKIASGSVGDNELIVEAARSDLPIILSTGMTNESELVETVCSIRELSCSGLTLLHCVSAYPTDVGDMNLMRMTRLRSAFRNMGVDVGLSDHSQSIYTPIAAVAMGATVIEKHITLDRRWSGPDHMSSLEPRDFARMVEGIRDAEKAMGNGELFPETASPHVLAIKEARDAWRNRA